MKLFCPGDEGDIKFGAYEHKRLPLRVEFNQLTPEDVGLVQPCSALVSMGYVAIGDPVTIDNPHITMDFTYVGPEGGPQAVIRPGDYLGELVWVTKSSKAHVGESRPWDRPPSPMSYALPDVTVLDDYLIPPTVSTLKPEIITLLEEDWDQTVPPNTAPLVEKDVKLGAAAAAAVPSVVVVASDDLPTNTSTPSSSNLTGLNPPEPFAQIGAGVKLTTLALGQKCTILYTLEGSELWARTVVQNS